MNTPDFIQTYLLYIVLPIWIVVGIADWACHRSAHIESTSGVTESLIHVLMLAEVGTAVLIGLFLEIDALVILLMIAAFVAHEVTAYWDLSYAIPRREVSALEQHVHDYLAGLPFMALSLVIILHWPQALALIGAGPEAARFTLAWKARPLPAAYLTAVLSALLLLEVLPYGEELWRSWRARR